MANVVVVGSQWGDEGKGKIVDWLSEQADIVVRFQGGHNAGHTLVINGTTYKLSLLPSGVVRPGKLSVIGNGVVLDPQALLNEIATLKKQNITVTPENLRIAENVTLILPLHRELDAIRESASAALRIGTTRRGIGPAYEDKVGRRAIRLMDLADGKSLERKIERLLTHHNALRKGLGLDLIDANVTDTSYANIGRAHTDGVESFVSYRPIKVLTLRADYTYTDATDDVLHQELLRRPRNKESLNAAWQATQAFSLNATVLAVSSWIDGNRDFSIPRLRAPGYIVANLAGTYNLSGKVSLFGRIDNLFDRHYENPIGYLQPRLGAFAGVKATF